MIIESPEKPLGKWKWWDKERIVWAILDGYDALLNKIRTFKLLIIPMKFVILLLSWFVFFCILVMGLGFIFFDWIFSKKQFTEDTGMENGNYRH